MRNEVSTDKSHVSLDLCFYCQEPKAVVLHRQLQNVLPREAVYDYAPCDKCKRFMAEGIICIGVRDGETDTKNPYRNGFWCVVKEDALRKIFFGVDEVFKKRVVFIPEEVWKLTGLPMIDMPERSEQK